MRLDRYLAEAGKGTRSEVKKLISRGEAEVNGRTVKDPGLQISEETDEVMLSGSPVSLLRFEYYMLNKPAGIISASRKNSLLRGRKPEKPVYAVDLIRESGRTDLFPAGRLDKETEGLLLITNDGQLAHRLLSPKFHVKKTYYAEVRGRLSEEDLERFRQGLEIGEEKPTKPCELSRLSDTGYLVSLTEGKYHQVRRMFAALGSEVTFLRRITFGPLGLDPALEPGMYRKLTAKETANLREAAEGSTGSCMESRTESSTETGAKTGMENTAERTGEWTI